MSILRIFVPAVAKMSKDTFEDAGNNKTATERLQDKIRKTWGHTLLVLLVFTTCGCFTRTIYVPHGIPVRLAAPIKDAPVWILDKNKTPVKSTMTIPEGWYALPMDKEKE